MNKLIQIGSVPNAYMEKSRKMNVKRIININFFSYFCQVHFFFKYTQRHNKSHT